MINQDKSRIIKSVSVKVPKPTPTDIDKDPALSGSIDNLTLSAKELREASNKKNSDIIDGMGMLKNVSHDQLDVIKDEHSTLKEISKSTKAAVKNLAALKKDFGAKIDKKARDAKPDERKVYERISSDGTIIQIAQAIEESNESDNKQEDIQKDIKNAVENYTDKFGANTSEQLADSQKGSHDDHIQRAKEDEARQEQIRHNKETRESARNQTGLMLQMLKRTALVGVALGFITKTLIRYSAAAVLNAAKWVGILFAIVAGIDVLSINLKYIMNLLNKSFSEFDTKMGSFGSIFETIGTTLADIKSYWADGEYTDIFWRVVDAIGDLGKQLLDAFAYALADVVATIVDYIPGTGKAGDRIRADALSHKLEYSKLDLTDDEIAFLAKQRTEGIDDVYDEFKNSKFVKGKERIKGARSRDAIAFSKMDYFKTDESGKERSREDQIKLAQYIIDMSDVPKEEREETERKRIQYANDAKKMARRVDENIKHPDRLSNLRDDYYQLQERFNADMSGAPDSAKAQIQLELDDILNRLDNMLGPDKSRKVVTESGEVVQPKQHKVEVVPDEDPRRGDTPSALSKMSEQMNRPNQPTSSKSGTNNVVATTNVVNNKTVRTGPIITARDVPGMYKSTEVNA